MPNRRGFFLTVLSAFALSVKGFFAKPFRAPDWETYETCGFQCRTKYLSPSDSKRMQILIDATRNGSLQRVIARRQAIHRERSIGTNLAHPPRLSVLP